MTRPEALDLGTVDQALAADASPWVREGDRLVLERRFERFPDAITFVDRVAELAEEKDHHPNIEVRYTAVRLELWTHDAGGLTSLDLELAGAISSL
jgi:4a-hydroxytetrahydrobiopterin dehydratase